MIISLIIAAAADNAIGKKNDLLWHLPNDLKFFKNNTWGMPVIMGRKTFESIAGEPLKGRVNIIITRKKDFTVDDDMVWVVNSLQEAIDRAKETHCKEVFIAGGGEIYEQALPLADRIYLTRVHATFPDAEVFFKGFDEKDWVLKWKKDEYADPKHAYDYSFELWERKK